MSVSTRALSSPSSHSSFIARHFAGQFSAHTPHATHFSRSIVHFRVFRSIVIACIGQLCSQRPQKRHFSMSFFT